MRPFLFVFALLFAAVPAAAQREFTVQLEFATGEGIRDTDMALTGVPLVRAWTDSVSIYFNSELRSRGPSNLFRAEPGRPGFGANYRVLINAIPLLDTSQRPVGITAYAVLLFKAPSWGNEWTFMTHSVGYTREPRLAAREAVALISTTLRAR